MKITKSSSNRIIAFAACCLVVGFSQLAFTLNGWEKIAGSARAISVGAGGHIYSIGTDFAEGGYSVYKWNGGYWDRMNIGGVRIAVARGGTLWVIQKNGDIYHAVGSSWRKLPGKARDIGISSGGEVWIVGWNRSTASGFRLYKWDPSQETWTQIPGEGIRIAIAAGGTPWVLTEQGKIYIRVNNRWKQMPGKAREIGIGSNGSVWTIGWNQMANGNYAIYRWNKTLSEWDKYDGNGTQISVAADGTPWVIDSSCKIWRRVGKLN